MLEGECYTDNVFLRYKVEIKLLSCNTQTEQWCFWYGIADCLCTDLNPCLVFIRSPQHWLKSLGYIELDTRTPKTTLKRSWICLSWKTFSMAGKWLR